MKPRIVGASGLLGLMFFILLSALAQQREITESCKPQITKQKLKGDAKIRVGEAKKYCLTADTECGTCAFKLDRGDIGRVECKAKLSYTWTIAPEIPSGGGASDAGLVKIKTEKPSELDCIEIEGERIGPVFLEGKISLTCEAKDDNPIEPRLNNCKAGDSKTVRLKIKVKKKV